jgi:hypothetical protein
MLITESQEIVRVAKGGNGSKELLGESEPITIDSPSPSSSGLQEQLQQYNQRQIQQMPLQPFYHQLKLPPSQPQQQPQQQLQHQPQHQTQYQPPVEPKRRNTSRSQEDFLGDVPPTIYTSNVARDLNIKKIQYLEDTNFHLIELLKQEKHEKNEFYNTLKSRIVALEDENRDMKKKMEETQLSNQNLTVLLEQERRIRKNDMELADQERKKIMKRS